MEFRLNLLLKNFGVNETPSVKFILKSEEEVKRILEGYKSVTRNYVLYKYEYIIEGNVFIQKRTELKGVDILTLI